MILSVRCRDVFREAWIRNRSFLERYGVMRRGMGDFGLVTLYTLTERSTGILRVTKDMLNNIIY